MTGKTSRRNDISINLIKYKEGESAKLDAKDKKILQVLDKNARATIAEISKKTGIQRDSVLYRINRMKKNNVIRFFHTVLNPSLMGYEIYSFVDFVLFNLTPEREARFLAFLKTHPSIVYVAKTTGKWDFTTNIVAFNLKEFDEIMLQIRMKFSDIIKEYETSPIIQEYKYDYMVDLIKK